MRWLLPFLLLLLFAGCAPKVSTIVDVDRTVSLSKSSNEQIIYVEVQNQTDEIIEFSIDLKNALIEKGYGIASEYYDVDHALFVEVMHVNEIKEKSDAKSLLSHINLGVGLGSSIGEYIRIGTRIGSDLGKILGDKLDTHVIQMICEVRIESTLQNSEETKTEVFQIIATADVSNNDHRLVLDALEEAIIKEIAKIF